MKLSPEELKEYLRPKDKADALINFSRNYGLNFLKNHEVKK
jgi:hypothetical protein